MAGHWEDSQPKHECVMNAKLSELTTKPKAEKADRQKVNRSASSDSLERLVSTAFPRIVYNGTHYRIETSEARYDQEYGSFGRHWSWETRYFWRARRRWEQLMRDIAWSEARKPERWRTVCCANPGSEPFSPAIK